MSNDERSTSTPLSRTLGAIHRRRKALTVAAVLAGFGFVGAQGWRHARLGMRDDPRYRVTAEKIDASPAPPWVRTDVRIEALRGAGLHGGLSILDPPEQLQKKLADAFAFHPWVERVGAITKRADGRIAIELAYRRPLAAVETPRGELIPVDAYAVRLPGSDLADAQLRYLPRVRGIASTSLVGEAWRDARVLGAVSLVAAFGDNWRRLDLVDIVPSRSTEVRGEFRFFVYDLITSGGTRIKWGAAPNATPPGEAPFAAKLARLQGFVAQSGPLRSTVQTPKEIEVRDRLVVTQRTAKRDTGEANGRRFRRQVAPLLLAHFRF